MPKKFFILLGVGAAVLAALVFVQQAKPHPLPTPGTQTEEPTITWSVPTLTGTMFPGTSSTTVVTFRSNQHLAGVVVEATPSLDGIVSASPMSFVSIAANQSYQLTFTLKAPPEFKKREFWGTIHIRNDGKPPKTYAKPLEVVFKTDFAVHSDPSLGLSFNYPSSWTLHPLPNQPYFTTSPEVNILEITRLSPPGTPPQLALMAIQKNKCPAVDSHNNPVDHVIATSSRSALFVLSCSATSEEYHYIFLSPTGQLLELTYHDDFDSNAPESVKLTTFQQIINSLSIQ